MEIDFKTAVFLYRAAKQHYAAERAKLIVKIHDDSAARERLRERKGQDVEEGFSTNIEIAEAELRELGECFEETKKVLTDRWGDVFE